MEFIPTHAELTISVCEPEFSGFAPVAALTIAQFEALPDIKRPSLYRSIAFIADLRSGDHTLVADKWVSDKDVERLTGMSIAAAIGLGRQRLAQINDEDAQRIAEIKRKLP